MTDEKLKLKKRKFENISYNIHLVLATLTGYFSDKISPLVALLALESAEVSV